MEGIRSILVIELLGGIGDVVMALPVIHALARSHPLAKLTVLTFAPGGDLLQTDAAVHRVICAQRGQARQTVDQLLSQESFDLIVSDTNYDGIADAIRQSNTPQVVTNLWQSPPPDELVSDRFLKILLQSGVITPDAATLQPQITLTATERQSARESLGAAYRPLIFLCPDAGMSIKRWSSQNFIQLGRSLQAQLGGTIIVPVGADQAISQAIVDGIGGSARLQPRGKLRDLAALLAEADLAIAADTGVARIAAALNIPTITLFGPSWHGRYGQPAPHINLQGFPACPERLIHNFTEQRCWYSGECPYAWETCLEDIQPETVLEAAIKLLSQKNQIPGNGDETRSPHTHATVLSSEWQAVRQLLVMRLDNIGDVMMISPALQALKENLPQANITLMASPSGAQTAALLPGVDEVLPWRVLWQDLGRLAFDPAREWQLVETLKERKFDAAIIFTSFAQSPHPPALICALAGIPLRLGESKEKDLNTLTHAVSPASDEIHQVERNLRLIEAVGFQVRDRRLILKISPPKTPLPTPYILLNPWTSCQSRNYDAERFAIAARTLSERTDWSVVVTGVEKDRDRAAPLLTTLGRCAIDLIGKTDLAELVTWIANANLILTNNTSTMHIADATGTPNVVMFAGTEQECQWQPRYSSSRLLRRPTVCSPCYAFTCPYELQCLDISANDVAEAALELLKSSVLSSPAHLSLVGRK